MQSIDMKNKKMLLIGFALIIVILLGLKLSSEFSDSLGELEASKSPVTGLTGSGFCGRIQERWKSCETSDDCIVTKTVCKWPTTFNKIYKAEVDKINSCMGSPANCAPVPSGKNSPSDIAICRHSKCELLIR